MKSKTWCISALFMAATLGLCTSAQAATITLDENGNGSIDFGTGPTSIMGSLQQDPGPGGQPAALTYVLNSPNLTAGDLLLNDSAGVEDIIRFNPAGSGGDPGYLASAVFYSSNLASLAGSSQPPFSNYANTLTLPGTNGINYTPTAGQPGFVSGFDVTYQITTNGVPEPSSLVLMFSGAMAVFAARRRVKNLS